jgi:hypothetical protein
MTIWQPIGAHHLPGDHECVALRIRIYWPDDDTRSYFEADDTLWPARQVDLRGPDREPVTAAILGEVLWIRDHADREAMAAYERQYGVLAEGNLSGWQDADQATEITAEEFEEVWAVARSALQAVQHTEPGSSPDRSALIAVLRGPGEACEPARAALRSGGDFIVWDGLSPADHLAQIYDRRLEHTRNRGIETFGLENAVRTLADLGQAQVRLGRVLSKDEAWAFILFLAPDATQLLACTGVRQRQGVRDRISPSPPG